MPTSHVASAGLLKRLDQRFQALCEAAAATYIDSHSPGYDRKKAENALFRTIGPLTEHPRWAQDWIAPDGTQVHAGDAAPRWTPEDVVIAMAGDPRLLDSKRVDARSPRYGAKGGSPIWRMARRVARTYGRDDFNYIKDLYSTGLIQLSIMMQPGYDRSYKPFISYTKRYIIQAMTNGVGQTAAEQRVVGSTAGVSGLQAALTVKDPKSLNKYLYRKPKNPGDPPIPKKGKHKDILAQYQQALYAKDAGAITRLRGEMERIADAEKIAGLGALLDATSPAQARRYANQVHGKYQTERSNVKAPGNIFGQHSPMYYSVAMQYADALESGDAEAITQAKQAIADLQDDIGNSADMFRGAATGMAGAMSVGDRSKIIQANSIDAPVPGKEGNMQLDTLAADTDEDDTNEPSWIDPETVFFLFNEVLMHDYAAALGPNSKFIQNEMGTVGGRMTPNEFRYTLRTLGAMAANYPGKGVPRKNTQVIRDPRDAAQMRRWWQPGEDPEIEPLQPATAEITDPVLAEFAKNGMWKSRWQRSGYPAMGTTAISQEMTEEVREFTILGVSTGRTVAVKKAANGKVKEEAVSKVAVNTALKAGMAKLVAAAQVNKKWLALDLDESTRAALRSHGITLLEGYDPIDAEVFSATADALLRIYQTVVIDGLLS